MQSPSSRRAWIEMQNRPCTHASQKVALLAEGVDRNKAMLIASIIEFIVALLAEGVDRNAVGV